MIFRGIRKPNFNWTTPSLFSSLKTNMYLSVGRSDFKSSLWRRRSEVRQAVWSADATRSSRLRIYNWMLLCWRENCHQPVGAVTLSTCTTTRSGFPIHSLEWGWLGNPTREDTFFVVSLTCFGKQVGWRTWLVSPSIFPPCLPGFVGGSSRDPPPLTATALSVSKAGKCRVVDPTLPTAMPLCKGGAGAALGLLAKSGWARLRSQIDHLSLYNNAVCYLDGHGGPTDHHIPPPSTTLHCVALLVPRWQS